MYVNSYTVAYNIGLKDCRRNMNWGIHPPREELPSVAQKSLSLKYSKKVIVNIHPHVIEGYVCGYIDTERQASLKHRRPFFYTDQPYFNREQMRDLSKIPVTKVELIMEKSKMPEIKDLHSKYVEALSGVPGASKTHLDKILRKLTSEDLVLLMYTISQAVEVKGSTALSSNFPK